MVNEKIKINAEDLQRELEWFREILKTRSMLNARKEYKYQDVFEISPPHFNGSLSNYAKFINRHDLGFEERFLLILSLTPHIKPELLDIFLVKNGKITMQNVFICSYILYNFLNIHGPESCQLRSNITIPFFQEGS